MANFKVKQGQTLVHPFEGPESKTYQSGDSVDLSDEDVKKYGELVEPAEGSTAHMGGPGLHGAQVMDYAHATGEAQAKAEADQKDKEDHPNKSEGKNKEKSGLFNRLTGK